MALNAALGTAMVRNQPAATAVHVDVGTLNYGGAVHTAWRGNYPVLTELAGLGLSPRDGAVAVDNSGTTSRQIRPDPGTHDLRGRNGGHGAAEGDAAGAAAGG